MHRFIVVVALASFGGRLEGQKVSLQLRPRVGDTISLRLEQETEVSGRRDPAKAPASSAPATASVNNSTVTYSRAVVESAIPAYTTLVAITDSVLLSSTDQHGKATAGTHRQQMEGQRVRLTVAPDGSIGMPSGSADGKTARASSLIPATFPVEPVRVGEQWTREAPLPAGTSQFGAGVIGRVKAIFRLDSVTRAGELAYVSIRGQLSPDPKGKSMEGIATVEDGEVTGYLVVDRMRGWLTESRFSIVAHSILRPAFGVAAQPMHFTMKLTQSLRTLDRK